MFLQETKKINENASWKHVYDSFKPDFLETVLEHKEYYQLEVFDYQQGSNE